MPWLRKIIIKKVTRTHTKQNRFFFKREGFSAISNRPKIIRAKRAENITSLVAEKDINAFTGKNIKISKNAARINTDVFLRAI